MGLDVLLPRKDVYAELLGGWSSLGGPFVRAEAGAKVGPAAVYVGGQATTSETRVEGGVRLTF